MRSKLHIGAGVYLLILLSLVCCTEPEMTQKQWKEFREAQTLYRNKKFTQARKRTTVLLAEVPHNVEIAVLHARIHFFLQEFDEAEKILKEALGYDSDNPYLLAWLGRTIAVHPKRQAEAAETFRKIIKRDPENYMAHYYLGRCLEAQKNFKPALLAYQNALAMERQLSRMHLHLGRLFYRLKLQERSSAHLNKVHTLGISARDVKQAKILQSRVEDETTP